jgi:hypothetical protein
VSHEPPAISFTRDELDLLNNVLNEVCNGVDIPDSEFATRLGSARNDVRRLLDKIHRALTRSGGAA